MAPRHVAVRIPEEMVETTVSIPDRTPDTDGTSDTDESPDIHKMSGADRTLIRSLESEHNAMDIHSFRPTPPPHARTLASTPSDSGVGGQLLGYTDRSLSRRLTLGPV